MDPRYIVPYRQVFTKTSFINKYNRIKDKLKGILQEVEFLSLTTDCWTFQAIDCFLTVIYRFIYQNELKATVFDTCQVKYAHTAINLAKEIEHVLRN